MDHSIIDKIKSVRIQINNICPMSGCHDKCPTKLYPERKSIPRDVVFRALDDLASFDYAGNVGYHTYNDPLTDPRLFYFIDIAKSYDIKSLVYTNAEYLTDELVKELWAYDAEIIVTTYTQHSMKLATRFGLNQCAPGFDDRLDAYTRDETSYCQPCGAPYSQIIIDVDGYVTLCCYDWASSVVFGDLKKQSLISILQSPQMLEASQQLSVGDRRFDICRRCRTHR